jgi:heme a synthase
VCQYLLGVTTLLMVVPVSLATLHQFGAVLLLTVMLVVVHRLSNAPRPRVELPVPIEVPLT